MSCKLSQEEMFQDKKAVEEGLKMYIGSVVQSGM